MDERSQHRRTASAGWGYESRSPLHVAVADDSQWGDRETEANTVHESDGECSDLSLYSHSPLSFRSDPNHPSSHPPGYSSYRHRHGASSQIASWHLRDLPVRGVRSARSQEGGTEPGHGGVYDRNAESSELLVRSPARITAFCIHPTSEASPRSPARAAPGSSATVGSDSRNGRDDGRPMEEGVGKVMKLPGSMVELKENMSRVFGVRIVRVMNEEWGEVDDVELIRDGDIVFALPEGGSPLGKCLLDHSLKLLKYG